MNWDQIFGLANGYAMVWWIVLAGAPRTDRNSIAVLLGGVGLLAFAYAILLIGILGGIIPDGGGGDVDFTTLAGVRSIFASDVGATVGWIHYLALDLFAGLWIARNATANEISRWVQLPILFLTLMAGPAGLLLYLALRPSLTKSGKRFTAPH